MTKLNQIIRSSFEVSIRRNQTFLLLLVLLLLSLSSRVVESGVAASTLITKGSRASHGEFPFVVQVRLAGYKGAVCSGTIISPNLVLTAAHCVMSPATASLSPFYNDRRLLEGHKLPFYVTAGQLTSEAVEVDGATTQIRKVAQYFSHEKYHSFTHESDLAILVLSSPFHLNDYVKPIPIATKFDTIDETAQICGWGVESVADFHSPTYDLVKANVLMLNNAKCRSFYGSRIWIAFLTICIADSQEEPRKIKRRKKPKTHQDSTKILHHHHNVVDDMNMANNNAQSNVEEEISIVFDKMLMNQLEFGIGN